MAILNGKFTSFDPLINVTASEPVYHDLTTFFPYTKNFDWIGGFTSEYPNCPEIEYLFIKGENCTLPRFLMIDCQVKYIELSDNCAASWNDLIFANGEPIESVESVGIYSVSEDWEFDAWSADIAFYFTKLKYLEVFEGWHFDLVCYSEELSEASLASIISDLDDLTESGDSLTLTIGEVNIAKLTPAQISTATSKGWSIE